MTGPAGRQFRCAFFARDYEATVAFYRDELELPVVEAWDRGTDDRGTILAAAPGGIEVLALPAREAGEAVWDDRPPQGVTLVIEVDDAEALCRRFRERGLPLVQALTDQPWGHRSFVARDPEGVAVYLFTAIVRDGP